MPSTSTDQRLSSNLGSRVRILFGLRLSSSAFQSQRKNLKQSRSGLRTLIGSGGYLDGEQLLPGFRYAIADLFKDWDWD
jgi:hypothetical protein